MAWPSSWGGGEAGAVFASGSGDIFIGGMDKAVAFKRTGIADVKVISVGMTTASYGLVASAKSDVKSFADLKGKSVGISGPGSTSDLFVRWGLKKAGLDPDKDATIIGLGAFQSVRAGIENGRVDGGMLGIPVLDLAVADGKVKMIADWKNLPFPSSVLLARTKDLAARPADFSRFMTVYKEALRRLKTDRTFAMKIAKLRFPALSDAELTSQLDFFTKVGWAPMDGVVTKKLYESAYDVYVGSGRFVAKDIPRFEDMVVDLPVQK
jgi:NitT/TauT family transport system substrate-binding protein